MKKNEISENGPRTHAPLRVKRQQEVHQEAVGGRSGRFRARGHALSGPECSGNSLGTIIFRKKMISKIFIDFKGQSIGRLWTTWRDLSA